MANQSFHDPVSAYNWSLKISIFDFFKRNCGILDFDLYNIDILIIPIFIFEISIYL